MIPTEKLKYTSPKFEVIIIEIEDCLATGSAITKAENISDINTEWEQGIDQNLTFSWN